MLGYKSSNPYRNDKYCDIPYTNYACSTGACERFNSFNNRPASLLITPNPPEEYLSCGCLAFENNSHQEKCYLNLYVA